MTQNDKNDKVFDSLSEHKLTAGRMIGSSKFYYRKQFPDNEVYFNCNIITEHGKAWWGDLDITISRDVLQKVANETNTTLYVLREMDARFGNENKPFEELKEKAVVVFTPNG